MEKYQSVNPSQSLHQKGKSHEQTRNTSLGKMKLRVVYSESSREMLLIQVMCGLEERVDSLVRALMWVVGKWYSEVAKRSS